RGHEQMITVSRGPPVTGFERRTGSLVTGDDPTPGSDTLEPLHWTPAWSPAWPRESPERSFWSGGRVPLLGPHGRVAGNTSSGGTDEACEQRCASPARSHPGPVAGHRERAVVWRGNPQAAARAGTGGAGHGVVARRGAWAGVRPSAVSNRICCSWRG